MAVCSLRGATLLLDPLLCMLCPRPSRHLVVVGVAQPRVLGVKNVFNRHVGADSLGREVGLGGHLSAGLSGGGASGNRGPASFVLRLPDLPVPVDEGVVHEEGGVTRRAGDFGHDGTNTVVTVGVRAELHAAPHVDVFSSRVARVNVGLADVLGLVLVFTAGETMLLVVLARSNVQHLASESLYSS